MRIRRRRLIAAAAAGLIAAAAGIAVALGDDGDAQPAAPSAAELDVRELAGERLVAGFPGPSPPPALRRMIGRGDLAGVVLFAGNLGERGAARRMIRSLQAIRRPPGLREPLLVMVDQEGGEVKRLPGAPNASAAQMGRRGAAFSRRQGRLTGANLRGVGIDVDLAPVLDVGRRGGVIASEQRSFGANAARVSSTAVPLAEGLQAAGVAATAKHFPGLGAATVNTDLGVARIDLPAATIRSVDEAPFRAFAAAGGELVMIGSAIYPALSPRPAAFSRAIATGELRDRIGFAGVSVTDELGAAAAEAFGSPGKVARAAAAAGTDLLMFRSYPAAARAGAALRGALRSGALARAEAVESAQRLLDLRAQVGS